MLKMKKRNAQASKVTPCPDCGKFGLIRYQSAIKLLGIYELRIRCKLCNSYWKGTEAEKLSQLIEDNHYITQKNHKW